MLDRRITVARPGTMSVASSTARIGAMPMPIPTRVTASVVRTWSEKIPYGPSIITLVPGLTSMSRAVPAPRLRTVMRSVVAVGAK